jgi:hypothetical protein
VKDANQGNAFLKLSGYETAMERRLFKALHELQYLPPGRQPDRGHRPAALARRLGRLLWDFEERALREMALFGNLL